MRLSPVFCVIFLSETARTALVGPGFIAAVWLPVMFVAVLVQGISSEEQMLTKELGDDYIRYKRKTYRLLPLVY